MKPRSYVVISAETVQNFSLQAPVCAMFGEHLDGF